MREFNFEFCFACIAPLAYTSRLNLTPPTAVPEGASLDEDGDMCYFSREDVAAFQQYL